MSTVFLSHTHSTQHTQHTHSTCIMITHSTHSTHTAHAFWGALEERRHSSSGTYGAAPGSPEPGVTQFSFRWIPHTAPKLELCGIHSTTHTHTHLHTTQHNTTKPTPTQHHGIQNLSATVQTNGFTMLRKSTHKGNWLRTVRVRRFFGGTTSRCLALSRLYDYAQSKGNLFTMSAANCRKLRYIGCYCRLETCNPPASSTSNAF